MPTPKIFFQNALRYLGRDCLLWPFAVGSIGYPKVSTGEHAKSRDGHRWLCELAHGPAPFPKAVAAHRCGVRLCLNPTHIRWTTQKENQADRKRHGTYVTGAQMPWSKLTEDDIKSIRHSKKPLKETAQIYGVSPAHVSNIRLRKSWKHL